MSVGIFEGPQVCGYPKSPPEDPRGDPPVGSFRCLCGMTRHVTSPEPVYVIGAPSHVGGADTELWHTLRLWRSRGLEVHLVPTWQLAPGWARRCRRLGCQVHRVQGPEELHRVPGLAGAIVVSFCNGVFLQHAGRLRELGCRVVWINCMTWLFAAEHEHYRRYGLFDHYVFQTDHQRSQLVPGLHRYGFQDDRASVIRGAFAVDDFPFCPLPHRPRTPFVVGRISRPDPDKFSAETWSVYARIPHPLRARVMAWDRCVEQKLGPPPGWAQCLPVNREPPQVFFGALHCMVQLNGGAGENWPRSGLEAMACGVPLVVENRWGWREMVRHGETGYLSTKWRFITLPLKPKKSARIT